MKDLVLLRHAKSSWSDPNQGDHARPLNGRGRRAAAAIARWMTDHECRPELVLCSTAMRTRETVAILQRELLVKATGYERGLYLASAAQLAARIAALDERFARVMLVAHNPGLEELARRLASGDEAAEARLGAKYPTAGLAWFRSDRSWAEFAASATLAEFVRPAELD